MLRTHARPHTHAHTMGVDMSCCLCDFYAQAHTISFLHIHLLCLYLLFRILKILLRTSNVSHSVDALIFMIVLSQICSQVCYVYMHVWSYKKYKYSTYNIENIHGGDGTYIHVSAPKSDSTHTPSTKYHTNTIS